MYTFGSVFSARNHEKNIRYHLGCVLFSFLLFIVTTSFFEPHQVILFLMLLGPPALTTQHLLFLSPFLHLCQLCVRAESSHVQLLAKHFARVALFATAAYGSASPFFVHIPFLFETCDLPLIFFSLGCLLFFQQSHCATAVHRAYSLVFFFFFVFLISCISAQSYISTSLAQLFLQTHLRHWLPSCQCHSSCWLLSSLRSVHPPLACELL